MTKILENETRVQGGEVNNLENLGRRKAVKTFACGVTVLAAYHILPTRWDRPIVESVFLPAHAATSGNTPPVGESFSVDAGYVSTYSVDVTPHIFDADGDTLTTALVGSGVSAGDIIISVATIIANIATMTVSGGTGNGYIDYTVSDYHDTSPTYRITFTNLDGM